MLSDTVGSPCLAYLDPSSIGIMLQFLLGILAASLLGVKLFWRKIAGLISPSKEEDDG